MGRLSVSSVRKSNRGKKPPQVNAHWIVGLSEIKIPTNPLEGKIYLCSVLEGEFLVGSVAVKETDLDSLSQEVESICKKPQLGAPRRPKTILFDNRTKHKKVKIILEQIEVTTGNAPELDEVIDTFVEFMQRMKKEDKWDYDEYPADLMEMFFRITKKWVEVAPWVGIYDYELFEISSEKLKMKKWYASVLGNAGESYGILLFQSRSSYEEFHNFAKKASPSKQRGGIKLKTPIIALNLDESHFVDKNLRKAAMVNHWPVHSPKFFPSLEIYSGNTRSMPPGDIFEMVTKIFAAMLVFVSKYHFQENPEQETHEINLDKYAFTITFPVYLNEP